MLSLDDHRHGSRAGYVAGCRRDCCRPHHLRYQKRSNLRRLREGSQYVDPAPIARRLEKWGDYGLNTYALSQAAGLAPGTLGAIFDDGTKAEKSTVRAVLAVTWDDLPDSALVYADLARWRVNSLMAAGHRLTWICDQVDKLNVGGKWRVQEKVTLGLARQVQAIYHAAPAWGPSKQTASKARNKGFVTPAAWDDPGVPAMPKGWKPQVARVTEPNGRKQYLDHAAIERRANGDRGVRLTRAETVEVVRRLYREGRSAAHIMQVCGIKAERYLTVAEFEREIRGGAA